MDRDGQTSRGSSFGNRHSRLRSQNSFRHRLPTLFGGSGRSNVRSATERPTSARVPPLPRSPKKQPVPRSRPLIPPPTPVSPTPPKAVLERPSSRYNEEERYYPSSSSFRSSKQSHESTFYDHGNRVYNHEDSIIEPMPSSFYPPRTITTPKESYSHRIYDDDQEDDLTASIMEPPLTSLKLPPLPQSNSYDEALARKMAAYGSASSSTASHNLAPACQETTTLIEIVPGVSAPLRGAQETWDCIANDFYVPCRCFCCTANLFCISDAQYVLCPVCKVVSPLDDAGDGASSGRNGVGLGFGFEDLQKYQQEMLNGR